MKYHAYRKNQNSHPNRSRLETGVLQYQKGIQNKCQQNDHYEKTGMHQCDLAKSAGKAFEESFDAGTVIFFVHHLTNASVQTGLCCTNSYNGNGEENEQKIQNDHVRKLHKQLHKLGFVGKNLFHSRDLLGIIPTVYVKMKEIARIFNVFVIQT